MQIQPVLALISSERILSAIGHLVMWALILGVLWWGLGKLALGEPFQKIGVVLLVLLTVVVLVNILLGLEGRPFLPF